MSVHLELGKTYGAILDAARNRRFISYGDLARANNVDWKAVHYKMPPHLWELVKVGTDRKWPMLTAIVVRKENIDTGTLDGKTLNGFINAAKELGFDVSNPESFVEEQRNALFAWAETAPDELILTAEDDADPGETELTPYGINDIIEDGSFLPQGILDSALASLKNKKNLILQGPPGTGKTWLAKRLGYALIGTKKHAVIRNRMCSIQFHPSLSYEDFVRGWRPDGNGRLSLIDGVFLESVEAARAEPDRQYVVIIEEINRGNPAQIFGEMLTLLENDKRREEEAVQLAYRRNHGERFFIPRNLYLIGTMNIADRSLALVDLALRRRFAFVTLEPALNENWIKWCVQRGRIDYVVLLDIQQRMNELNDEIAADRSLGAQFRIGHSYVTPKPDDTVSDPKAWFRGIVETEIQPLLEEYWFDSPDKVETARTQLLQGF